MSHRSYDIEGGRVRLAFLIPAAAFILSQQVAQLPPPRQGQPPRDATGRLPPEPKGTAVIRGRVLAADTGSPIRRATVSLQMVPPPAPPAGSTGPAAAAGAVTASGISTFVT